MRPEGLDHATLRCRPQDLPAALAFYRDLLGLQEGPRPAFDFPGHWLYAGGRAVLHLAARQDAAPPAGPSAGASFEHIAFRLRGLAKVREELAAHGTAFVEQPLPGMPVMQLFLTDPFGLRVELNFDMTDAANAEG
ncbi:glyoxalase [Roseomonas eburnea]|uniref:Glyoxalase n=1 Tax=Neoroseomonas eburnea TaxID=1346889 RepID=A0A9X9XGW4_9PROT|nr:VOC family protein [Neoroseomonas eburnea]MBR0682950.1 glyoxalase [Neoroseomonas eburnea]